MDQTKTSSQNGVIAIFQYYWHNYGGWKELLKSCYFWAAVVIALVMFGAWSNNTWCDLSIGILPSMMGFSLGGYAILLAFGNDKFLGITAIAKTERCSAYEGLNATFTHFIFIQVLGLLYALVLKSVSLKWAGNCVSTGLNGIGIFLMVYAILLGLASTMALLRFSKLYNCFLKKQSNSDSASDEN